MSDWNTPLTFTATSAGSTVALNIGAGTPSVSGLQYRTDTGAWLAYTPGTTVTLANVGDFVQFQNTAAALSTSASAYVQFAMTGHIDGSGNVQSLLNYSQSVPAYAFYRLFRNCTALETPPELPAMTLSGNSCYREMFRGSGITNPPELPATTLPDWNCYSQMFYTCLSLLHSPELPAETLTSNCYTEMFAGCSSLVYAGRIHGKTYGYSSCNGMFSSCTSLSKAPDIEWTTFSNNTDSMGYLFNNTEASYIRVAFKAWNKQTNINWLNNVSPTGYFYKPSALPEIRGANYIPQGWIVVNYDAIDSKPSVPCSLYPLGGNIKEIRPITLTAAAANSTVKLVATGGPDTSGIHYRLGTSGTWLPYTMETVLTLTNAGDSVQFLNKASTFSTSSTKYIEFVLTGSIEASGDTMSLLNFSNACNSYCFYRLFRLQSSLITPSEVPSTNLAERCYDRMFIGTHITAPPKLPATTLINGCYDNMLSNSWIAYCPIIKADSAPADSMREIYLNSRAGGFVDVLPRTVGNSALRAAIQYCRVRAAHIRATSFSAASALRGLFYTNSYIKSIEVDFTQWDAVTNMTLDWVYGVPASGVFIKPAALPEEYGVSRIPTGWTVINK